MTHDVPPHPPGQQVAEEVAEAMWRRDHASRDLHMSIVSISPGSATLTMPVRRTMLNGHGICHGGYIFTLADSAFAYACNSHNHNTVAAGCSIEYLQPAREGDLLIASAVERHFSGRTGIYDIAVTNQAHETIAFFRGKSTRIRGDVISGLQALEAKD
jgi:acyl-CoA thioesterase